MTSDLVTNLTLKAMPLNLNCAAYSHPRSNFCNRLKLPLWYVNTDGLTPNNSTIIKRVFLRAEDANGEAYELATCCRGEHTLNECAIGVWNDRRIEKTEDLWEYALHPNPYLKPNTIGKVSGMVQVIREDMEGELHVGSPMAGRSRWGSMRVTRHL
ncbi:hypothetical protein HBI43_195610 [Parastagonospora nodorum]|nr:hypothetical protein HBI47_223940 [Parastagonospora nodorum]KAH6205222.1 hypothetical protein HBI43_195610 [Parastagonospora nodorum]